MTDEKPVRGSIEVTAEVHMELHRANVTRVRFSDEDVEVTVRGPKEQFVGDIDDVKTAGSKRFEGSVVIEGGLVIETKPEDPNQTKLELEGGEAKEPGSA